MPTQTIAPPRIMTSAYYPAPRQRGADLPGMISLGVRELFPDIEKEICPLGGDLAVIGEQTEAALARVDMSMIESGHTVNILCTEHGFSIQEGDAYAEMLRTIRNVVRERTGCDNIRLRLASGAGVNEAREIIRYYRLDDCFGGKAIGIGPFDKGVPIETEIGTLYGLARAYDGDWFIHAHCNDPRELHFHRLMERSLKPFVMSYARLETRSVYHMNFGNRSANFIQRAIFNAPFVRNKFAFCTFLMTSPDGITGVEANNDLIRFDREQTVLTLRAYGKLSRLFAEIDRCVPILDADRWSYYIHAGGMTFGFMEHAQLDAFDLTVPVAVSEVTPLGLNPAIGALVINHVRTGLNVSQFPMRLPTIVVGREMADTFIADATNPRFMDYAVTAENLETAIRFACRIADTDKTIVFDGSFGNITLSPTLAAMLREKAPEIGQRVDRELLPKWLRQRGIDPKGVGP